MSHIVEEQTQIANPDLATLRQACEIVAAQHGGEVTNQYLDYRRNPQTSNTGLAITTPQMFRGIGLKLDEQTGQLTFIGDSWGVEKLYKQVQEEITQTYVSLAWMTILRERGYQASADQEEQQVSIRGVQYA